MPKGQPELMVRREWTEDCRVLHHRECPHIGTAHTYGLLGHREFVTICDCPCHWACPSEEVALSDMSSACDCSQNGERREANFEHFAKPPSRPRVLGRWR